MTTRFQAKSYSFAIKRRKTSGAGSANGKQAEDLRLIWHDYPGQWFEQDPSGPVETARRIDGFRSLLTSNVALLLVDGQRLLDNAGEEERYLKSVLTNFSNGLLRLKDQVLVGGKPLVNFPRIWVVALSKADLLPNLDAVAFRDLLVEKAAGELIELRTVLSGFVVEPGALSVGEDFVLLSAAKFQTGKIEVTKRIGLDLILPMAAMLPFARFAKWASAMRKGGQVAEQLMNSAVTPVVSLIAVKVKLPGPLGTIAAIVGPSVADFVVKLTVDKVVQLNAHAKQKQNYVSTMLTNFELELDRGEAEYVLLRSAK